MGTLGFPICKRKANGTLGFPICKRKANGTLGFLLCNGLSVTLGSPISVVQ